MERSDACAEHSCIHVVANLVYQYIIIYTIIGIPQVYLFAFCNRSKSQRPDCSKMMRKFAANDFCGDGGRGPGWIFYIVGGGKRCQRTCTSTDNENFNLCSLMCVQKLFRRLSADIIFEPAAAVLRLQINVS